MDIDYLKENLKFGPRHLKHAEKKDLNYDTEWVYASQEALRGLKNKKGWTWAMLGQKGTGKTQLAACFTLNNLEERRKYGVYSYLTAMRFFMFLKSCYAKDSLLSEYEVMDFLRNRPLLILDEVHVRAGTEWEDNMLLTLLDERYAHEKDTILISNLTADQFEKTMGTAVVSRINETGKIMVFDWKSFREGAE